MVSPGSVNVMTMPNGAMSKGTTSPYDLIDAPNVTNDPVSLLAAKDDADWSLPYVAYSGPAVFSS